MRVVVVGAGVGGLAAAVRLAHSGHSVTVLERATRPGGKCGRVTQGDFTWDTGPSLLTMPWVLRDLFAETGARLEDELELVRVEPVTRYRFADDSSVDLSADLPVALEALEAWSPGAGTDWARFLGTCAGMWRAATPFMTGAPPWPPRLPRPGDPRPDPRDLLRVRPWSTISDLARAHARDPRLRMVIERFATYAGADPRHAPAALALAGYVEHAFGAWYLRGGLYELVRALVRRLEALGGRLLLGSPVDRVRTSGRRVRGVTGPAGDFEADVVVANVDHAALAPMLGRAPEKRPKRSLSGLAVMLGLRGATHGQAHHTVMFPADYAREFDDIFIRRVPPTDPTVYVSAPPGPASDESWFVLVNAPAGSDADWGAYEERLIDRLGIRSRIAARARRTPADLATETGAVDGAIYGAAAHGRLATLRRPGNAVRGVRGLWLVGGTVHPGGGLPLVALGAASVARAIGPP